MHLIAILKTTQKIQFQKLLPKRKTLQVWEPSPKMAPNIVLFGRHVSKKTLPSHTVITTYKNTGCILRILLLFHYG